MSTCSVITATWQRHEALTARCIPSVQAQDHPDTEHVVISDGPDEVLREKLAMPWLDNRKNLRFRELAVHEEKEHWGSYARAAGLELAGGEYITYCDDDDVLRPEHCRLLAAALDAHPEAGFAVSRMLSHQPYGSLVIGAGPLALGDVGTPMIMHRRAVLETASWGDPHPFEDWNLVWAWVRAGVSYVRVDEITSDVWPSVFR
jgi:glycosyltransferase involved in cell wall biosynthesis